jgi:two-component system, sensor histidine kinase and response regulator
MRLPIRFSTVAVAAVVGFVIAVVYIADRELSRSGGDRVLRTSLWCIAAVTLGVLTVAVLHERRLSRRVAERSAELERLSQELLQANRAKSEFLATVSHELRTPLNAIVGFVDLMRDGVYGELTPRQVAPVERIEASATHLRHLVDQILDLAKIAAGRVELHIEPVDLRPFILDVAADIEPLVNEKGLVLTLGVGGTLPKLRTDPTHLRQILVNLLGNAIKYTPAGGIDLRARVVPGRDVPATLHRPEPVTARIADSPGAGLRAAAGDVSCVAIHVADTGIGIGEPHRQRIFEEFERIEAGPGTDSGNRGTGLGLSISRRLARVLGGDITLESELLKGSTFTVWLPVDPVDALANR